MAAKAKGNILYEIIIVVLVVALLGSILYPAKVWKRESEEEVVCRARIESIQHMQLQYITQTGTYTDSLSKLIEAVTSDDYSMEALDSLIMWDRIVEKEAFKELLLSKEMPGELRNLILTRLGEEKPLGNLAKWDSLQYDLMTGVKEQFASADTDSEFAVIEENIYWPVLTGEDAFWAILDSEGIPSNTRTRSIRDIQRRGLHVYQTPGWRYFKPYFFNALNEVIATAESQDIWEEDKEDDWEKFKKKEWEADLDALPQVEKDSLWIKNQRRLWDRKKELIWKDVRKKLFREEREKWQEDNSSMWEQVLAQRWRSERRKTWKAEAATQISEELLAVIPSQDTYLDSLWKIQEDSLRSLELEGWLNDHKKETDETIYTLWSGDRRVTWEDSAFMDWLLEKESDQNALWSEIKEDLWTIEKLGLWQVESDKRAAKLGALKRLDQAIIWQKVLGSDKVTNVVDGLDLPDSKALWQKVDKMKVDKGSVVSNLGLAGMFREDLLGELNACPVSHTPYLITVIDTSAIKRMSLYCPIVESEGTMAAVSIDPVTGDTSQVELTMTASEKLLGGGAIKNHGHIDTDGKKSWERRGR